MLIAITVAEGETVPVNSVVGTIGQAGEGEPASRRHPATKGSGRSTDHAEQRGPVRGRRGPGIPPIRGRAATQIIPSRRRIAKEHNVDVAQIHGSGAGGRVTKNDILEYLDVVGDQRQEAGDAGSSQSPVPAHREGERIEIQPLSVMRKKIAEHMVLSRRTSAHVHSVFHVSFATVDRIRQERKQDYERRGAKLTYMTFIAKAVTDALRRHPLVNASLDGDNIVYKKDINLGIAVAIDGGLIVPVVKNADEKNMLGLSRAIADVADRARAKQLKPEEVHGGTFTITNPGQFGAQFGMPIINQPQVAILGVGTIEKRPIVINDAIGIRTMAYLTLGYDHRLIDGATADQFMADVKQQIEQFDPSQV